MSIETINDVTVTSASASAQDGLCVWRALIAMDPHARENLADCLTALNEALKDGDVEAVNYVQDAMRELVGIDAEDAPDDLDDWTGDIASTSEGRAAAVGLAADADRFFERYQSLKASSGLTTIRAVAEAAGLSPTTVQAYETQKVKPQFKTVVALAKAFCVEPSELI